MNVVELTLLRLIQIIRLINDDVLFSLDNT